MKITVDFEDVPYAQSSYKRLGMRGNRKKIGAGKTTTTREVANILEQKYHIVRFFLDNHAEEIAEPILGVVNARMAFAMQGGPAPKIGKIGVKSANAAFVDMIKKREMDGKIPGVPTEASKGYTRKRLGPNHKGFRVRRRPSFYDTGLYANAFRLKVEV